MFYLGHEVFDCVIIDVPFADRIQCDDIPDEGPDGIIPTPSHPLAFGRDSKYKYFLNAIFCIMQKILKDNGTAIVILPQDREAMFMIEDSLQYAGLESHKVIGTIIR